MNEAKWYLRTQDDTFGPETREKLIEWARLGRIQPGQEISEDKKTIKVLANMFGRETPVELDSDCVKRLI